MIGSGRCTVESEVLSPDRRRLAVCCKVVRYLFVQNYVGTVYTLDEQSIEGRLVIGKRTAQGWTGD